MSKRGDSSLAHSHIVPPLNAVARFLSCIEGGQRGFKVLTEQIGRRKNNRRLFHLSLSPPIAYTGAER